MIDLIEARYDLVIIIRAGIKTACVLENEFDQPVKQPYAFLKFCFSQLSNCKVFIILNAYFKKKKNKIYFILLYINFCFISYIFVTIN